MTLLLEQLMNGLQLGVTLFLIAAGLTLVFGIMGLLNLAHGSLYMLGAYTGATVIQRTGSFALGAAAALVAAALAGLAIELLVLRRLYRREHLDQVLATFGLILFFNEATMMLWGRQPLFAEVPALLSGSVPILPGVAYPVYRLFIIGVGLLVCGLLYGLVQRTRIGMLIRAGATHPEMVQALGVDMRLLYIVVFALGALLAGLAGFLSGPVFSVQVGMGEQILILAFVVVVIGGIGSIRGALAGALLVGVVDTLMRSFAPDILRAFMGAAQSDAFSAGLSSMAVYLVMAAVLLFKPAGLFATGP